MFEFVPPAVMQPQQSLVHDPPLPFKGRALKGSGNVNSVSPPLTGRALTEAMT